MKWKHSKIFIKRTKQKDTWKEMKKVQRYFKSPLYAVKALDRGTTMSYTEDSSEPEISN